MFKKKTSNNLPDEKDKKIEELQNELLILEGIKEAMPDPYFVRDMDYNIIVWPEAIEELTGYSYEEAKKIKCGDLFKADVCKDCPTQKCIVSKNFLKDAMVDVYNKNGDVLNALVSNAGVYDTDGNPIGAVEIVKDNTRHQQLLMRISDSSEQLSAISEELAASSEQVSAMSNKLESQSQEVSETSKDVLDATIDINNNSNKCVEHTNNVRGNIDKVNDSMNFSIDKIDDLIEKSTDISQVVIAIQNIANQTNLLALNASIEAARAGDSGLGFGVVAEEIRKLAEDSERFSREIEDTIKDMNELVEEVTSAISTVDSDFRESEESTNEMIHLISEISNISDKVLETMKDIENNIEKNLDVSTQQNVAMEELAEVAQNVAEIAQVTQLEFDKIKHDDM